MRINNVNLKNDKARFQTSLIKHVNEYKHTLYFDFIQIKKMIIIINKNNFNKNKKHKNNTNCYFMLCSYFKKHVHNYAHSFEYVQYILKILNINVHNAKFYKM